MNTSKFFKNVTVTFTESSRRKGGYFNYTDVVIANAFMELSGNKVIIHKLLPDSNHNVIYSGSPIVKMTTGQTFKIVKSTEITERQFKNCLKSNWRIIERNRAEKSAKDMELSIISENNLNNAKSVISSHLTVEIANEWKQSDRGNSGTRRTRWANRADRLGLDRSYGNLVRDMTYQF